MAPFLVYFLCYALLTTKKLFFRPICWTAARLPTLRNPRCPGQLPENFSKSSENRTTDVALASTTSDARSKRPNSLYPNPSKEEEGPDPYPAAAFSVFLRVTTGCRLSTRRRATNRRSRLLTIASDRSPVSFPARRISRITTAASHRSRVQRVSFRLR